jgi:hypothetical protein
MIPDLSQARIFLFPNPDRKCRPSSRLLFLLQQTRFRLLRLCVPEPAASLPDIRDCICGKYLYLSLLNAEWIISLE